MLHTHPDIAAAAVVGRSTPSDGEEPVGFVVPHEGAVLDADEVKAFVAEQVLPYKKIRHLEVLDTLPVSTTGKIVKTDLRRRADQSL